MHRLVAHGFGRIAKCSQDGFAREPGMRLENLVDGFAAGELSQDEFDGDAGSAHNRLSQHHVGIGLDQWIVHGALSGVLCGSIRLYILASSSIFRSRRFDSTRPNVVPWPRTLSGTVCLATVARAPVAADATGFALLKRYLDVREPALPEGCVLDVEFEAKELLTRFLPAGRAAVEEAYRGMRAALGMLETTN